MEQISAHNKHKTLKINTNKNTPCELLFTFRSFIATFALVATLTVHPKSPCPALRR